MLRRALAAAIAIGLLGSGCTKPVETPEPVATVQPSTPVDVSSLDPARLAAGGSFRASVPALPTTWNPWHPASADPSFQLLLEPLRSRAFVLDSTGVALADQDQVVEAEVSHLDATVVRLKINPKAVWGDGTPVTARDWVSTWKAFGVDRLVDDARGWDRVTDVSAGSTDRDVVVRYSTVDPDWVQPLIDGPARAESVASKAEFEWGSFRADWTAGPFVVEHIDEVQGVITLTKNPHWWGSEPRLDRLSFRVIPGREAAAAFGNDELDWLPLGLDLDAGQRVRTASDSKTHAVPGTSGRELVLGTGGALSDIAVRRAIIRAIDADAVARAGLGNFAKEAPRWANPLLLPSQPGYSDQAVATGMTYDPAAARAALSKAGWFGSLTLQVSDADLRSEREAEEIIRQLGAVGLSVSVTGKGGDLVLRSRSIPAFPLVGLEKTVAEDDPNVADVAARIASEVQPVRRADLAARVARTMWLGAESLPLYQEPNVVAAKNRLANITGAGYSNNEWENIGWAR